MKLKSLKVQRDKTCQRTKEKSIKILSNGVYKKVTKFNHLNPSN